jgi:hypothetical protein
MSSTDRKILTNELERMGKKAGMYLFEQMFQNLSARTEED